MPDIHLINIPPPFIPLTASIATFIIGVFLLFLSRYFWKQHRLFEEQRIRLDKLLKIISLIVFGISRIDNVHFFVVPAAPFHFLKGGTKQLR
ncbi:MAG: hypothetical protein JW822_08205 [Spirochaetales bacterium]|nr:hypothetical protein [Spirochaetales bacterium]